MTANVKVLVGLAVTVLHAALFLVLAQRCRGHELVVDVRAANASPMLAIEGDVPASLARRVQVALDDAPPGPGLQRKTWTVAYRGGFVRSVGVAQLVGPFQDPDRPACSGRVTVSQRLLDGVGAEIRKVLEVQLVGESITGAGSYRRVDAIALRWARLEWHPDDRAMVGEAPHGYVRAALSIVFDRVTVPVVLALVPQPIASGSDQLAFRIASRATLVFGNRVAQWISDRVGGPSLATRLARAQIDGLLLSALAPPPPFELGDGQTLRFAYCGEPVEIIEGQSGALPFAVAIGRVATDPAVLPPRRGPARRLPLAPGADLAIDVDLDALNAVLFELWRGGFLDRRLAAAGLDTTFNTDPLVQELLSLRISPVRLALPPVIAPAGDHLRLSADARVTIADGDARTVGRVWGGLDFRIGDTALAPVGVELGALALTCEHTPVRLAPCYGDLVAAIRDRGSEFHGALTDAFTAILADIFVERRVGASGLPADLVIRSAVPRVTAGGGNASLHLDLAAMLVPAVH